MLEDLIELSGDFLREPTPTLKPKKQRLPRFFRVALRVAFLPFVYLEAAAYRLASFIVRPPYKLKGSCKKRGNCCYFILMQKRKGVLNILQKFWAFEVQGFYLKEKELVTQGVNDYYVMGCRYLKKDGSCSNYRLRPSICRKWPNAYVFHKPFVLKGCGYYPVKKSESKLKVIP